jgi:hypothetical protein
METNNGKTVISFGEKDLDIEVESRPSPKTKTPFFKELSDAALRAEYKGYRELAYNNAAMAASGAVNIRRCASQMGRLMRNIEIIEAIAKKRGISLV